MEQAPIEKSESPEQLILPHAETAIELYENEYDSEPHNLENLREIYSTITEQALANTEIYSSSELGAAFPASFVRIGDIARALYTKQKGEVPETTSPEKPRSRKEFVFGSAFAFSHGDQFVFAEETMHQIIKRIPQALEDLRQGIEPEDFEIYTAGMPTNTLGNISPSFLERLQSDSVEAMSDLYTEFVASKTANVSTPDHRASIELYGISMGGGFAAKTGEKLVEHGEATQDSNDDSSHPYLQIRSMVPVSLGKSNIKYLQIPLGFVAEGIFQSLTNPAVKGIGKRMETFQTAVANELDEKGITDQMSPEQRMIKKKALISILTNLGKTIALKETTRLTQVIGLNDPTMYTPGFSRDAEEHRGTTLTKNDGVQSLGDNMVPGANDNTRTFGVDMGHTIPFFRQNEFKRMRRAAEALDAIKS